MPTWALACCLLGYGLLLAGPASSKLAAAGWTARMPRAALVLWQAVCLGAGLGVIGSGVVLAVAPLGGDLLAALLALGDQLRRGHPFAALPGWRIACGVVSALLTLWLLAVLVRCFALAQRRRRVHRRVLDLLSGPRPDAAGNPAMLAGVRVLDHPSAVAYSVPGRRSRVVLSAGLVDLLTPDELAAVVEHERAHLRSRHDILVLPFQAWAASVGRIGWVRRAQVSVAGLAEMLADDVAARRVAPDVLVSALAAVARAGGVPAGADVELSVGGAGPAIGNSVDPAAAGTVSDAPSGGRQFGAELVIRVRRLRNPRPAPQALALAVYLLAVLIVVVPAVVLLVGW